jgi:hypothetical protein
MAEVKEKQSQQAQKKNRHVVIALAHMNKRRDALVAQRDEISDEIEELEAAILALQ